MCASKNGKIAGIVVYKPKVITLKVTVELGLKVSICVITNKFSEILGSPLYSPIACWCKFYKTWRKETTTRVDIIIR